MERYLVFGRTDYAEPLVQHGLLEVPGRNGAEAAATARFGADWVELCLVPETACTWVLTEDGARLFVGHEVQVALHVGPPPALLLHPGQVGLAQVAGDRVAELLAHGDAHGVADGVHPDDMGGLGGGQRAAPMSPPWAP